MSSNVYNDSYYFENLSSSDIKTREKAASDLHKQYKYLIDGYCSRKGIDKYNSGIRSDIESIYNQIIGDLCFKILNGSFSEGTQKIKTRVYSYLEKRHIDLKRKQRSHPTLALEEAQIEYTSEIESVNIREQEKQEKIDKVLMALKMLEGRDCSEILTLYYLKNQKSKEISELINKHHGTVRNNIGKCKEELMKLLEEKFDLKKENLWT